MSKPRLLDLFSGAGGSARGYQMAGFHVTGVDIKPQPRYAGDQFLQRDAVEFLTLWLQTRMLPFDAIHASPPCQAFTQMSARWRGTGGTADQHPDLLTPTLDRLRSLAWTVPWVVENVVGARRHMRPTVTLHGGMFGLDIHRPRLFESNVLILAPKAARTPEPIGVYGAQPDGRRLWTRLNGNGAKRSIVRAAKSLEEARRLMEMPWAEWREIAEAIPPAYTLHIGRQLLAHLERTA